MPLYDYRCQCGATFRRFLKLAHYREPQACACGRVAEKVLTAPAVRADYAGYTCPITGDWIEGKRAHEANLAKHGCRVLEAGETAAVERRRLVEEAALDKAVEDTADEFITNLPAVKRERLAAEIDGGMDIKVTRS